jgi:hypothetical protein
MILVFHFCYFFFLLFACFQLQCDSYDFNLKVSILSNKFYKLHIVEVLFEDPCTKKKL